MQLFTEFIKSDLTEDQILPVLRQLLPVLLNILGAPEVRHYVGHANLQLNIVLATFCIDALTDVVRLPPMRRVALHGEGPVSRGRQRGGRLRSTRLA